MRDGETYEVTQTADGEFWVNINDEEFVPGMLAGLADLRDGWTKAPNDLSAGTAGVAAHVASTVEV